MVLLNY